MKQILAALLTCLILMGMLQATVGCGSSPPTQYYVLSPLNAEGSPLPPEGNTRIGVGPIRIPEYMLRGEVITLTDRHHLQVANRERWAEPLDANISRVLAENLSVLIPTNEIRLFPWMTWEGVQIQVSLDLVEFGLVADTTVSLIARWSVIEAQSHRLLTVRRSEVRTAANAQDYRSIVAGMSKALERLSRDIATEIQSRLPATPSQPD